MEMNGIFNFPTKFVPGPGNYNSKSMLSNTEYSFRPRTKDPNTFSSSEKNPGPGAYNHLASINN